MQAWQISLRDCFRKWDGNCLTTGETKDLKMTENCLSQSALIVRGDKARDGSIGGNRHRPNSIQEASRR